MGRKIPARKHHGVRDPLVQAAKRFELIKDKIDNPPEKKDFQKVSNRFAEFIKLKEEAKKGRVLRMKVPEATEDRPENYTAKATQSLKGKRSLTDSSSSIATKSTYRYAKELPSINRFQNEPDEDYLRRVNRITQESIKESQFEAKYNVDVVRNEKTGEIKLKKRPADEIDERMKAALAEQKQNGGTETDEGTAKKKKKRTPEVKLSTDERRKIVKGMMLKKKKDKAAAASKIVVEYKKDEVKFGEVTHGPPTLVTPRRAQKAETVARPGAKKNLLLHSVLTTKAKTTPKSDSSTSKASKPKKAKIVPKTGDLKGKRKELPEATRKMIELQQEKVMDLYRQLKKTNRLSNAEA